MSTHITSLWSRRVTRTGKRSGQTIGLVLSLAALLTGCAVDGTPGTAVPASQQPPNLAPSPGTEGGEPTTTPPTGQPEPTEPTEPTVPDDPTAPELPPGCLYSEGLEPTLPGYPADDCRREWVDEYDVVTHIGSTQWSEGAGPSGQWEHTRVHTVTEAGGTAIFRTTVATDADENVTFDATEHLMLEPLGTLPCTYGQPATWATRTEWAGGEMVRRETDMGFDGSVEGHEEWEFDEGGVLREHRRFSADSLDWSAAWRADGQPAFAAWSDDSGTWTFYDDAGLRIREEQRTGGVLLYRTDWTMLSKDQPLSFETSTIHPAGENGVAEETLTASGEWEYDAAGTLRVKRSRRTVYGYWREQRTEFDALGRETYFREDTEDNDCHAYERRQTWAGESDRILASVTTCDGTVRQRVDATFDAAGRIVKKVDTYGWGNGTPHTHESVFAYDSCGARVLTERRYDGVLSMREENEWDDHGRLTKRTRVDHDGEPRITEYAWDEAGRLVQAGAREFVWDAEGRLVETTGAPSPLGCWELAEPGTRVRFDYTCPAP